MGIEKADIEKIGVDMYMRGGVEALKNLKEAINKSTEGVIIIKVIDVIDAIDHSIGVMQEI